MQWYYSKNGTQLGPVEEVDLRSKLATGEVSPSDLIWREGMTDWQPVARVPEFGAVVAYPHSNPTLPAAGAMPQSPYAPPGMQTYVPQPVIPGAGKATASMVLGIVSLVISVCGCYSLLLVIPCAILAIVFGGQVKALVEANQAPATELGKAKAGVIMGWIAIGVNVLITVLIIGGGVASGFMQDLH